MRYTPATPPTPTAGSKVVTMPPTTSASNAISSGMSLVEAKLNYQEPIVMVVYADAGAGKSHLVGTADKLGLLPTEAKTIGTVVRTSQELGNQAPLVPNQQLIRVADPALQTIMPKVCLKMDDPRFKKSKGEFSPGAFQEAMQEIGEKITIDQDPPKCCQRHYFRWHVKRMTHFAYLLLADSRVKTIAIDSFGTFCSDVSYANYGTTGVISAAEFGFAPREDMNKELREFLNAMNRKNLILTHHAADVWENNQPTGRKKPESAWKGVDYFQTLEIELVSQEIRGAGNRVERVNYQAICRDCQANPTLIGKVLAENDSISFPYLAMKVFPESDESAWG